jgi:hypothetical protein
MAKRRAWQVAPPQRARCPIPLLNDRTRHQAPTLHDYDDLLTLCLRHAWDIRKQK